MNGSDPAFATPTTTFKDWSGGEETEVTRHGQPGLTKRELFAAMAMQAIISKHTAMTPDRTSAETQKFQREIVCGAVCYADALIKELSEPPK